MCRYKSYTQTEIATHRLRYCLGRSTVPSRSLPREYECEGASGEGEGGASTSLKQNSGDSNSRGQAVDRRVWRTGFCCVQCVKGVCHAAISPLPLRWHCICAFNVEMAARDEIEVEMAAAQTKWPCGTRAMTGRWSKFRPPPAAQTKIFLRNCACLRCIAFTDLLVSDLVCS